MPPIDPAKVTAFLAAWNAGRPSASPLWVEVQGINALMSMTVDEQGKVTYYPSVGFPVMVFMNTENKEIKLIDARRFSRG